MDLFNAFIGYLQSFLTIFYNLSDTLGYANYGVAIILMTIVIKMLLYPLTVKQVKSMKAMQEMQPEMKKLQEKYKNKPAELQKEMASLYSKAGVNPLAGCLPLIAQMPILIGIFYAIRDYVYEGSPTFFWVTNLSQADPYYILPVVSALTTYIQQKQTTVEVTQQTKMMMIFMPLFIGWISLTFPSGLVLYWVVSNIMQILQQWWMYRSDDKLKGEAA
ncbi:YidC/Oxa1 family membrane protein insertase [Anaerosinus massiliensis]|uniref:YidC/Oxa1 family membrane protein insertase n=1 Tax=Massilibacillus massiliensis TaxID=1806837 RepID=UPI000AB18C76|nr:YidC/Oxa1 family membrane protein insertase [Massilibacillus massiliensis]